jgi:hypothetical protein
MSRSLTCSDEYGENQRVFSVFLQPDCFGIPLPGTVPEKFLFARVLFPDSADRVMDFLPAAGHERKGIQVRPWGGLILS